VTPQRPSKELGDAAEAAAAKYLKSRGYTLLTRNFSTRGGEVDIIAVDGKTVCFVEVRARSSGDFVPPYATVGPKKQARIRAAAARYVELKRLQNALCRFDVISVLSASPGKLGWDIEHVRDAF